MGIEDLNALGGQLAGRAQDQGPRITAGLAILVTLPLAIELPVASFLAILGSMAVLGNCLCQSMENGKGESPGLPGASLGTAEYIPPGESLRNSHSLDGGRGRVAFSGHRANDGLCKPQVMKSHTWLFSDSGVFGLPVPSKPECLRTRIASSIKPPASNSRPVVFIVHGVGQRLGGLEPEVQNPAEWVLAALWTPAPGCKQRQEIGHVDCSGKITIAGAAIRAGEAGSPVSQHLQQVGDVHHAVEIRIGRAGYESSAIRIDHAVAAYEQRIGHSIGDKIVGALKKEVAHLAHRP